MQETKIKYERISPSSFEHDTFILTILADDEEIGQIFSRGGKWQVQLYTKFYDKDVVSFSWDQFLEMVHKLSTFVYFESLTYLEQQTKSKDDES